MPNPPNRIALASAFAAALAATGCASPEKPPEVASTDTIACRMDGQRIVIRFLPDEARLLTPDGERVTLQKVPASSGIRYTNGMVEVRGGGGAPAAAGGLQFIRDGNASPLLDCAPLMVPGAK